jgi:hypothetical protein
MTTRSVEVIPPITIGPFSITIYLSTQATVAGHRAFVEAIHALDRAVSIETESINVLIIGNSISKHVPSIFQKKLSFV